jgi:hypothetical protein
VSQDGPNNVVRVRGDDRPMEGGTLPVLAVRAFYSDGAAMVVAPTPVTIRIGATPVTCAPLPIHAPFVVEHGTNRKTTTLAGFTGVAQAQVRLGLLLSDGRQYTSEYLFSNRGEPGLPGAVSFSAATNDGAASGINADDDATAEAVFDGEPPFAVSGTRGTITLLRNYFETVRVVATVAAGGAPLATVSFACNLVAAVVGDVDLGVDSSAKANDCDSRFCVPGGIPPNGSPAKVYIASAKLDPISVRVNTKGKVLATYKINVMYDPRLLRLADNGVVDAVTPAQRGDAGVVYRDDPINAMVVVVAVIQNSKVSGPNELLFTLLFEVVASPEQVGRTEISAVVLRLEDNQAVAETFAEDAVAVAGVIDVVVGDRRRRLVRTSAGRRPAPGTAREQGGHPQQMQLHRDRSSRQADGDCDQVTPGDTNGDCKFTAGDSFFVLEFSTYSALGFAGSRGEALKVAFQNNQPQREFELDADGDGEVLTSDAFYLQLIDAGSLFFVRDVSYTSDADAECLVTLSALLVDNTGAVPNDGEAELFFDLGHSVPTVAAAFAAAELTVQTGTVLTGVGGGTHIILRAERVGARYVASFFLDFPLANTGVSVLHLGKAGPGRSPLYQFMAGAATNDGGAQAEATWFAPLNLSLPADSYFGGSTRAIESRIVSSGVDGYHPKARYEDAPVRGYCKRTTRTETTSTGTTHTNTTQTTGTATETTTTTRTTSTATSVSTATWATATTATTATTTSVTTTTVVVPKNVSEVATTTAVTGLVDAASKRKRSRLWWVVLVAVLAILVVLFLVVKKRRAVAKQGGATAEAAVDSDATTEVSVWSQESEYDHLAARLHEKSRAADLLVVNEMYSTGDDDGDDAHADELPPTLPPKRISDGDVAIELPPTLPPKRTSDGDVAIEGVGESRYATGESSDADGTALYDQTTDFNMNENELNSHTAETDEGQLSDAATDADIYDNAIAGGMPHGGDDENMYDAATGAGIYDAATGADSIYDTAAAGDVPIEDTDENMYDSATGADIYDTAAAGNVPIEGMYDAAAAGSIYDTAAAGSVPIEDNDEAIYDAAGAGMVLDNDGGDGVSNGDGELNIYDVAGTGLKSGAVYDGVELDDLYDGLPVIMPDVHVDDEGAGSAGNIRDVTAPVLQPNQDTDDVPKKASSRASIYSIAEVFNPQDDPQSDQSGRADAGDDDTVLQSKTETPIVSDQDGSQNSGSSDAEAPTETEKRGARVIDSGANVIDLFNKRFDEDGDGTLTRAELMTGLERKPTIKAAVTKVGFDMEALFAELDRDGNGRISINEFLRGMEPVLVVERESRLGTAQPPVLNLAEDVDEDEDGDLDF